MRVRSMIESIFIQIVSISLGVSVLFCVMLLFSKKLTDRYGACWKTFLWGLLALRLLLPFSADLYRLPVIEPSTQIITASMNSPEDAETQAQTGEAQDFYQDGNGDFKLSAGRPDVMKIISVLWLTVGIVLLLTKIGFYLHFLYRVNREKQPADEIYRADSKAPVFICRYIDTPMTTGVFRNQILLPAYEMEENQIHMILLHENCHIKRRDLWWKAVLMLVGCIHWFNPLILLFVRHFQKDMELACDEAVLRNMPIEYRKDYSETILEILKRVRRKNTVLTTSFTGGKNHLRERFRRIFDCSGKKKGTLLLSANFLLVFILGAAVTLAPEGYEPGRKELKAEGFTMSVPSGWLVQEQPDGTHMLLSDGREAGTVSFLMGEKDDFASLYGNHVEVMGEEVFSERTGMIKTVLRRTAPAAALEEKERLEIHYYQSVEYTPYYYDIAFYEDAVSQQESDRLAESFQLNDKAEIAIQWAYSWQERDGKIRYASMSEAKKQEFEREQGEIDGHMINSIGWSSPWVERYQIETAEDWAVITYFGKTSDPLTYTWKEKLFFGEENGRTVVTESSMTNVMEEGTSWSHEVFSSQDGALNRITFYGAQDDTGHTYLLNGVYLNYILSGDSAVAAVNYGEENGSFMVIDLFGERVLYDGDLSLRKLMQAGGLDTGEIKQWSMRAEKFDNKDGWLQVSYGYENREGIWKEGSFLFNFYTSMVMELKEE